MKRPVLFLLLAACAESTAPPSPQPTFSIGQDGSGQVYFAESCTACHAHPSGFDLAYFSYSDTNIVRRALGHVDSTKSWAIANYIATLQTPHVPQDTKLFQPGGSVIPGGVTATGDVNFAVELFGVNAWPDTLTPAGLAAKDPKLVRQAFPFFVWSDEAPCGTQPNCNKEWMTKDSIPLPVLTWNNNAAQNALSAYLANETSANLDTFIEAVAEGASNINNSIAPCAFANATKRNLPLCFEIHRWVSTLIAQRVIQGGAVSSRAYLEWWDTGDFARRSRNYTGQEVVNSFTQWSFWMDVGWIFDPVEQPCVYTADALIGQQLKRHAVFICLRSMIVRAPGDFREDTSPYMDFQKAANKLPSGTAWSYNGGKFALDELLRRLNGGDIPPTSALKAESLGRLNTGMNSLQPKVSAAEFSILNGLANQVRGYLQ